MLVNDLPLDVREDVTPSLGHLVVGDLLALSEPSGTALVRFPGQVGRQAVEARSTINLHGGHIGQQVLVALDQGDPMRPIVLGVLRGRTEVPDPKLLQVEVDSEEGRLIVSAVDQLVLRCGKAKITLTRAGKVLIEGTYVSSRSSGVNRLKGGSVQLN